MKPHPDKEKIVAHMIAREKWEWIRLIYGCSFGTMSRYKKQFKIPDVPRKITDAQRAEIKKLRKKSTLDELAVAYGVSNTYIAKICGKQ